MFAKIIRSGAIVFEALNIMHERTYSDIYESLSLINADGCVCVWSKVVIVSRISPKHAHGHARMWLMALRAVADLARWWGEGECVRRIWGGGG